MGEIIMKITKDTKIGDLIPENVEISCETPVVLTDPYLRLVIELKKKEVKNFEWYVYNYLNPKQEQLHHSNIRTWINSESLDVLSTRIIHNDLSTIPFGIKIGLLKFICDDIEYSSWYFDIMPLYESLNPKEHGHKDAVRLPINQKIQEICPKEFLESIFK
jgi:hypothetical protein